MLSRDRVEIGIFVAVTSEGLLVSGSLAVLRPGLKDVAWQTLVGLCVHLGVVAVDWAGLGLVTPVMSELAS